MSNSHIRRRRYNTTQRAATAARSQKEMFFHRRTVPEIVRFLRAMTREYKNLDELEKLLDDVDARGVHADVETAQQNWATWKMFYNSAGRRNETERDRYTTMEHAAWLLMNGFAVPYGHPDSSLECIYMDASGDKIGVIGAFCTNEAEVTTEKERLEWFRHKAEQIRKYQPLKVGGYPIIRILIGSHPALLREVAI